MKVPGHLSQVCELSPCSESTVATNLLDANGYINRSPSICSACSESMARRGGGGGLVRLS